MRILPPEVAWPPDRRERLRRAVARSLSWGHPHTVRTVDIIESATGVVAVMLEAAGGVPWLDAIAARGGANRDLAEGRRLFDDLSLALVHAHERLGISHGGVALEYVWRDPAGRFALSEFGVAMMDPNYRSDGDDLHGSGEQTVADDLWRFGVLLHEFFGGERLSGRDGAPYAPSEPRFRVNEVRRRALPNALPIPADWESAIESCLALDPASRPASVRELRRALGLDDVALGSVASARLDPVLSSMVQPVQRYVRPWYREQRWWVGLGVVIAVGSCWALWRQKAELPVGSIEQSQARPSASAEVRNAAAIAASKDEPETAPPDEPPVSGGRPFQIAELGLTLEWIPPGRFTMGSARDGVVEPLPVVVFERGFWMGRTEVTQAQWLQVMPPGPRSLPPSDYPAFGMTYPESQVFCGKLTEREREAGRLPGGYVFMVPSEAEWEYACRAGGAADFSGALAEYGWFRKNSGNRLHEVGRLRPNAWNLYDMHGNVDEWCRDRFSDPMRGRAPGVVSDLEYRGFRGGNYLSYESACRATIEQINYERSAGEAIGVRVALIRAEVSGHPH